MTIDNRRGRFHFRLAKTDPGRDYERIGDFAQVVDNFKFARHFHSVLLKVRATDESQQSQACDSLPAHFLLTAQL